ncbi:MAG: hypothetical protein BWK77_07350 [Verrucomicrobia bacterium A1]|nr:MAG: hypothetical protein BWK77_07350 [Verrucomicrobia bacterium A1]
MPGLEIHSEGPDKGRIKKSCANLMALIRPLVIVDEAHNAKTDLSYDVLNRVRAGCVIEFTATPAVDSNVLHHVSASILKDEAMIKLPIILAEKPSWQEALTDSILQRTQLDELARNEKDFVRPIVLIQAESKDREVTVEVVEKYLVEQGRIEKSRIAIATGSQRDLDGVNLLDPACKIEFVITVQALKEGWDCPFAYVFCSVATVHSEKDVEQLLGRVLRMPWAQKRSHPALNWAYAFVSKACWPHAVSLLHDRLVHMGFDEVEAIRYLKPVEPPVFPFAEPPRERALREKIESYWAAAAKRGYQQSLFAPEALVETSFDYSFAFDPESYPAARHYPGGFQFPKHFDPEIVAAFDNDEELECAKAIEMCPHVVQWARNVPGMFGLPVWSGTFYPDFVAQLDDGRRLVVEYKGAHLIEHDQPKKNVGELWERTSGGKALFLWATKKDSSGRDVARQLEDKIAR